MNHISCTMLLSSALGLAALTIPVDASVVLTPIDVELPGVAGPASLVSISGDGLTLVGFDGAPGSARAFRWTAVGGSQDLGGLPGAMPVNHGALAVSFDGSKVLGQSNDAGGVARTVRWANGGIESIPDFEAGDVTSHHLSGNGEVAIGNDNSGTTQVLRWTSSQGVTPVGQLSPGMPSYAGGVNVDGSVSWERAKLPPAFAHFDGRKAGACRT